MVLIDESYSYEEPVAAGSGTTPAPIHWPSAESPQWTLSLDEGATSWQLWRLTDGRPVEQGRWPASLPPEHLAQVLAHYAGTEVAASLSAGIVAGRAD